MEAQQGSSHTTPTTSNTGGGRYMQAGQRGTANTGPNATDAQQRLRHTAMPAPSGNTRLAPGVPEGFPALPG